MKTEELGAVLKPKPPVNIWPPFAVKRDGLNDDFIVTNHEGTVLCRCAEEHVALYVARALTLVAGLREVTMFFGMTPPPKPKDVPLGGGR